MYDKLQHGEWKVQGSICQILAGGVKHLLRLGGLGERFSSPSGSGRSPAAKRYLVNFRLKISPLVATIFRSFSGNETSNWGAGWPSGNILPRKQTVCTSQWHGRHFASMWQPFLPPLLPLPFPSLLLEVGPLITGRGSGGTVLLS